MSQQERIDKGIKGFKKYKEDEDKYNEAISDSMLIFIKGVVNNSRVETYEVNFIVNGKSIASTVCRNAQKRKIIEENPKKSISIYANLLNKLKQLGDH